MCIIRSWNCGWLSLIGGAGFLCFAYAIVQIKWDWLREEEEEEEVEDDVDGKKAAQNLWINCATSDEWLFTIYETKKYGIVCVCSIIVVSAILVS